LKRNWIKGIVFLIAVTSILAEPVQRTEAATVTTITRSQVEQRAENMINLAWTYNASKNGVPNSTDKAYVTQVKQLQGVTTEQMTGIPYDWGGLDGVDLHSYNEPWTGFLDAVNKGAYTGNTDADGGIGYVPGTAGLDCSGFVQAAYDIQGYKQSTSTLLNKYFVPINLSDIKHMDILDKPGDHVAIFNKWGTLNGVKGAFTYECTPDQTYGGIQGAKSYFISMNTINTGYIPARYINVVDDPVNQTVPVSITSTTSTSSNAVATIIPQFKIGGYAQVTNVINYGNLRSASNISAKILTTVPKGTILNLMDFSNGWYKVSYNGQTGWMAGTLFDKVPINQYVIINNAYQLNIRADASSTAQILGVLMQGQYAQKLGQTADGSWYKISINGVQGWSSAKYLRFIQ
jgi:uncharacterized protein YraI